jgi:hypothetical protein
MGVCCTHPHVTTPKVSVIALLFFFLVGIATSGTAQTANTSTTKTNATEVQAKAGTYQLIFNNRREDKDIQLNAYQLATVEKLRKDNETVYARASYSDDIRVKILPRNVINQGSFKPQPLKYFKDEHPYEEYSQIRYVEFE